MIGSRAFVSQGHGLLGTVTRFAILATKQDLARGTTHIRLVLEWTLEEQLRERPEDALTTPWRASFSGRDAAGVSTELAAVDVTADQVRLERRDDGTRLFHFRTETDVDLPSGLSWQLEATIRRVESIGTLHSPVDDMLGYADLPELVLPARTVSTGDAAVFCPPVVARATAFLVQVLLYPPECIAQARDQALEADPAAQRRGVLALPPDLTRGTRLDLHLEMPSLIVTEPDAWLSWTGTTTASQFEAQVPADAALGNAIGRVRISIAGVPFGTASEAWRSVLPCDSRAATDLFRVASTLRPCCDCKRGTSTLLN